jgi:hypothetical protein
LSIILFLLRILPDFHEWILPLHCFAAWIIMEETTFTIGLFFQCRPINYYWDKTAQGSCFDQPAFYYADASFNMATDLCILALPWIIFRTRVFPCLKYRVANHEADLYVSRAWTYGVRLLCSVGVLYVTFSLHENLWTVSY